jgi:hypothetical protein
MTEREPVTMGEKLRSPRYCLRKLREKGLRGIPGWLADRVWRALKAPIQSARIRHANRNLARTRMQGLDAETLYAFYDLTIAPPTFDIVVFLGRARQEQHRRGCARVQVVIVPEESESFCKVALGLYELEHARWRVHHLLISACLLLPNTNVMLAGSRHEAEGLLRQADDKVFPPSYTVACPITDTRMPWQAGLAEGDPGPKLRASTEAREVVQRWAKENGVGDRRMVTITLREASHFPERNANTEAWAAFAKSLDLKVYCPVVIRDFETAFDPLAEAYGEALTFNEAIWNMELRFALYELSFVCMSASTGPDVLCLLGGDQIRYLIFKLLVPGNPYCNDAFYHEAYGIRVGEQLAIATPFQRLVWEDDSLEVINAEFAALLEQFEDRHE